MRKKDSGFNDKSEEKLHYESYYLAQLQLREEIKNNFLNEWNQNVLNPLNELDQIAKVMSSEVMLVILWDTPKEQIRELKKIGNEKNWTIIDLNNNEINFNKLTLNDGHPNELGHKLISEKIFNRIIQS